MRNKIVAGNWKMHTTLEEGVALVDALIKGLPSGEAGVILGLPFTHLTTISHQLADTSRVSVAAQNCHQAVQGAFTGEISAPMLRSVGCRYVILGHSERREYFGETDELIASKIDAALAHQLLPIYCCGEDLSVRDTGKQNEWVGDQIRRGLFHLEANDFQKIIIAYEPVWAIGTGRTASPEQAQEMHFFIRRLIAGRFGEEIAAATPILYGGSVKAANAASLFSQADVDGGLVGGASLSAAEFLSIIEAAG
jgi:triosephosphate isomerase